MTTPKPTESQPTPKPARSKRDDKKQLPESPVDPEILSRELSGSGRTTVERFVETDEERTCRLRINQENAQAERDEKKAAMDQRRWTERAILVTSIGLSVVVCGACLKALFDKSIPAPEKAWASPILTTIVGGFAGFWGGRSSSRTPEK